MNRKEAVDLLPIIKAFSEGKVIQTSVKGKPWEDLGENIAFYTNDKYRIKPESAYRPFANTEECWTEMLKHQPLGWLYEKENNYRSLVTSIYKGKKDISINGISGMSLDAVMKYYTFVDGTPFGIKIKE